MYNIYTDGPNEGSLKQPLNPETFLPTHVTNKKQRKGNKKEKKLVKKLKFDLSNKLKRKKNPVLKKHSTFNRTDTSTMSTKKGKIDGKWESGKSQFDMKTINAIGSLVKSI